MTTPFSTTKYHVASQLSETEKRGEVLTIADHSDSFDISTSSDVNHRSRDVFALKSKKSVSLSLPPHSSDDIMTTGDPVIAARGATIGSITVFLVTWLTYAAASAVRRPVSLCKTSLGIEMNLSSFQLGILDSAFFLPYGIALATGGAISDKYGSRIVLALAMGCTAMFTMGTAYADSFFELIIFLSAIGIFQAFCWPACIKALSPWFTSASRSYVFGLWCTCQSAGGLGGTIGISMLVDSFGWRRAMFLPGLITLFTGWLAYVFLATPEQCRWLSYAVVEDITQLSDAIDESERNRVIMGSSSEAPSPDHDDSKETDDTLGNHQGHPPGEMLLSTPSTWSTTRSITSSSPPSTQSVPEDTISHDESATNTPSTSPSQPAQTGMLTFQEARAIPNALNVTVAYFFLKVGRYSLIMWLPTYFRMAGHSIQNAALLSSCFEFGNVLGSLIVGTIVERCFRGRKVRTATVLSFLFGTMLFLFVFLTASTSSRLHTDSQSPDKGLDVSGAFNSSAIASGSSDITPPSLIGVSDHVLRQVETTPTAPDLPQGLLVLIGIVMFAAGVAEPGALVSGAICADLGEYGGAERQAALAGFVNGLGTLGTVLQGPVVGLVSSVFGWTSAFILLACACLVGGTSLALGLGHEEAQFLAREEKKKNQKRSTGTHDDTSHDEDIEDDDFSDGPI